MKKLFLSFCVASAILILTTSQKSAPKTKVPVPIQMQAQRKLTVSLDLQTWNAVIYVINQSDASHKATTGVLDSLLRQLNDTTLNPLK